MIKIVKLAYSLNTEGKGKARKRTLDEVRTIIRENGKPPAADTTCVFGTGTLQSQMRFLTA
jgi:hypothetical protein